MEAVAEEVVVAAASIKQQIPKLGVGLGYRTEIADELKQSQCDYLEIIPENYFEKNKLKQLFAEKSIVIPHGVDLSIASHSGIKKSHLSRLKMIIDILDPPYWSEHISFSSDVEINLGHLSPVPFDDTSIQIIESNLKEVRKHIKTPLILENITYDVKFDSQYSETDFINKLCEKTEVGLLLDVTNLFINSKNHDFNALKFLEELNPDNVIQFHIIGYEIKKGLYVDTHGQAIQEDLWELYKVALNLLKPNGVIIEWDNNFPHDFGVIKSELAKAQELFFDQV